MWPQPFLNESNDKSLCSSRDRSDDEQQQKKFDFSEPFKIPKKQQSLSYKTTTIAATRELARSLFSQLSYPIVVTAAGDMMFTFEKPPVRLNGILHRAVDSIVRDGGSSQTSSTSSSSSSTESSSFHSNMDDSQVVEVSMTRVSSSSFRRSPSPFRKQLQQRDYSSNSILAALKSLGTKSNTKFSSIFIKPKSAKQIEQAVFYTKKEKDENSIHDEKTSKSWMSSRPLFDSSKIVGLLPDEPKEIRLNESVEELLKSFSNEDSLLKTSQDETTSFRPQLFSTSGAIISSSSSLTPTHLFNYRAKSKIKNLGNNDTTHWLTLSGKQSDKQLSADSTIIPTTSSCQLGPKWTCLVCLSKHLSHVNVCSICGSSKPQESASRATSLFATTPSQLSSTIQLAKSRYANLNQSKSMLLKNHHQFSAYLLNRLGYNRPGLENQHQQQSIDMSTPSTSTSSVETTEKKTSVTINPYLKKWTCRYCNFSNDSLKIVCLNCRWVKTCLTDRSSIPSQSKSLVVRSPSDELKQFTPKKATEEASQIEAATTKPVDEEVCCATCNTPIRDSSKTETMKVSGEKEEKANENDKSEAEKGQRKEPSLSEIFSAEGEKKWKCSTCLVSNTDTIDKCSCCSTPRPGPSTTTTIPPLSATVKTQSDNVIPKPTSVQSTATTYTNIITSKPFFTSFQTPHQLSQFSSISTNPQNSNELTTIAKTETSPLSRLLNNQDKWKCNMCLVMNENDKVKCVACQTERPRSTTVATGFGFGAPTSSLFPSKLSSISSISEESKETHTTSTTSPQLIPNITVSSTSVVSDQFKSPSQSTTDSSGFKVDFSSTFKSKDSPFKLPILPASSTASSSSRTQTIISPFNLAPTPSLNSSDVVHSGFKFPSSIPSNTTTSLAQSFSLPSSSTSGFSFDQPKTDTKVATPAQLIFAFPSAHNSATPATTATTTSSVFKSLDKPVTTTTATSVASQHNQLLPTFSFGLISNPTTVTTTSTNLDNKLSTLSGFNFQPSVQGQKRPNVEPAACFSPSKSPNTSIGGTAFSPFNLATSTPSSFMLNTPPQAAVPTTAIIMPTSGSFPNLLAENTNPLSATTSLSTTTTATTTSLFGGGSTFLSPSSTGSPSTSNNFFLPSTGLTQQPKFNFTSPGSGTAFSLTPHINFTSTETPFKFSASNETQTTPTNELRKIRRATRRNR